jgi:hypothetical protein
VPSTARRNPDHEGPHQTADDQPPLDAEHIEELVSEGLFLSSLAPRAGPVVGELNGAVVDFVP